MSTFIHPPELPTTAPRQRDSPVRQVLDLLAALHRSIWYW